MLRKETPDFVAVTGDIVSGFMWNQSKGEPDFWKRNFAKMATILEADGIPFGIVPGWHDFDADVDQDQMMEICKAYALCAATFNPYRHNR